MPLTPQDWERLQRACGPYRFNLGGVHRRNRLGERPGLGTGSAIEFQEHRAYQPGDDLRRLDWSAYARSGQMVIRLERQEVMPQLDLVLDLSRSMWGLTDEKRLLFEESIAAILILAGRNGLDVRCMLAGDQFRVVRSSSPAEILAACDRTAGEGRHTLLQHMPMILESRRRLASQLWISDLLFDHDPLLLSAQVATEAVSWAVLQVLDAQDAIPETAPACLIEACEDHSRFDLTLDEAIVRQYCNAFDAHRNLWRERTFSRGGIFASMTAPRGIEHHLMETWVATGLVEPQ